MDDEPGACNALHDLVLSVHPGAQVVGVARNALDAAKVIQRERPDIVFLDIEMPHGSGFDLLEIFPDRTFHVVFTTAHEEHAVRAAHTHPFDYLLKPVDPDDLTRVLTEISRQGTSAVITRIEVASTHGKVFIPVDDLVRIEADGSYSTIHTAQNERYTSSKNLGHFESILPAERFFRCHNSHLLAMSHVKGYDTQEGGSAILRGGQRIPVSSRRWSTFLERLNT